jgi:rfaE bifunctional protein kinase chain/domain
MKLELSRVRLEALLEACRSLCIGVIGDFTLDGYWYADMSRAQLSRETPLYNRPVVHETYTPGAAANVASNLAALGTRDVWAFTVVGDDWRGSLLCQVLSDAGVRLDAIWTQPGWKTPFFGKVMLEAWGNQQEDARLDFVNAQPLPDEAASYLLDQVAACLPSLDALIVADYHTIGVVTPEIVQALNDLADSNPQKVFVADSRERIDQFHSMVIKPNEVEATRAFFPGREPGSVSLDEFVRYGMGIYEETGRPVYITLGQRGALLCHSSGSVLIPVVPVPPPLDTVGAGDTFVASLAAGLAGGGTPSEAGCLASLAVAVTVRKLGVTGTTSPEEILDLYDSHSVGGAWPGHVPDAI